LTRIAVLLRSNKTVSRFFTGIIKTIKGALFSFQRELLMVIAPSKVTQ
jgi:hypothetical protein